VNQCVATFRIHHQKCFRIVSSANVAFWGNVSKPKRNQSLRGTEGPGKMKKTEYKCPECGCRKQEDHTCALAYWTVNSNFRPNGWREDDTGFVGAVKIIEDGQLEEEGL
jgi:hypothetical protein